MADMMDENTFPTLTPYIVVRDARAAIDFYTRAFGAKVRNVAETPDGKVMNAQLVFGDSVLMLNDEFPEYGSTAPHPGDRTYTTIHISSKDIDNDFQRAVDAGAEVTMPLENMFWGDRFGQLKCPFGYSWSMGQKISNPSPEEYATGAAEAFENKH